MVSNSILKPYSVNWLINNKYFANFGTYNTFLIDLKIPFGKLKTIMPFPHTLNVLLFPRYIWWLKINSSKVENASFLKVWCYETPKSTNRTSLQIADIDKAITRYLIWFDVATCEEPLNFIFLILFRFISVSYKMAFDVTIVASFCFKCFSFLNFYQSTTLLNF